MNAPLKIKAATATPAKRSWNDYSIEEITAERIRHDAELAERQQASIAALGEFLARTELDPRPEPTAKEVAAAERRADAAILGLAGDFTAASRSRAFSKTLERIRDDAVAKRDSGEAA